MEQSSRLTNVTSQVYITNNVKHKDLKRRRDIKYVWEAMLTWIKIHWRFD